MLTEDEVNDAVASYLKGKWYSIISQAKGRSRGDDIQAQDASGNKLRIEVKGEISSKAKANGDPAFDTSAKQYYVALSIYRAMKYVSEGSKAGIALPSNDRYLGLIKNVLKSLVKLKLGIMVYYVDSDDKTVEEIP